MNMKVPPAELSKFRKWCYLVSVPLTVVAIPALGAWLLWQTWGQMSDDEHRSEYISHEAIYNLHLTDYSQHVLHENSKINVLQSQMEASDQRFDRIEQQMSENTNLLLQEIRSIR